MQDDTEKWRAAEDLRTLVRAAEIRRDSKRYKAAQALARKQYEETQAKKA